VNTEVIISEVEVQEWLANGNFLKIMQEQDQRPVESLLEHGNWLRAPRSYFPSSSWSSAVNVNEYFLEFRSFARHPTSIMLGLCDLVGTLSTCFFALGYTLAYDLNIVWDRQRHALYRMVDALGMASIWFMVGAVIVGRLYWSLRTVPRQKWTVVRFLRHEQMVAVNHAWPVGSVLANTGRERLYRWDQLNPIFRRDLSDAHLPALGVLVMDGTKAVDYLEFGLGIENPGTAREQWEFLRRYMTFDSAPLPAARRVPWYTSPLAAWRQTVDHLTLLAYPNVRSEPFVLWTRFVSAVFNFVADLIRWQPMWSAKVLVLSGQKPWMEYSKAVVQTLAGWLVFAGLCFGVWWLVQRL
jgi:hypothetical protein